MKQLFFSGKRKFITIPLAVIFGLAFLPFVMGGSLAWLSYKKIDNKKLQYAALTGIGLLTLFFGSAWAVGVASPPQTPVIKTTEAVNAIITVVPTVVPTYLPSPTQTRQPTQRQFMQQITASGNSNDTTSVGTFSGTDKDCEDFSSQNEAQAYFNSKGGSASNNVDRLDGDHDGTACESLP